MLNIPTYPGVNIDPGENLEVTTEGYSLALDFDGDVNVSIGVNGSAVHPAVQDDAIIVSESFAKRMVCNNVYVESLNKLFIDNTLMLIHGAHYFKAQQNHIFMNWQQFEPKHLRPIRIGDKVHIFIDKLMDPFYGNDFIFEFIVSANILTKKKVIIHVPYYAKELRYSLEAKLDGSYDAYKIRLEHNNVIFRYSENILKGVNKYLKIVIPKEKNDIIFATSISKDRKELIEERRSIINNGK